MVAIYLDPTEPAKHAQGAYGLLAGYLLFAITIAVIIWIAPGSIVREGIGLAIHAGDLVVYSLLVYVTHGPTSPFFAWFVFALFSAAMRFGRRGVIWTSVVAIVVFNATGVLSLLIDAEPDFELNRFLIRSAYLAIVAVLLVYLVHYQSDLQADLLSLSAWPRSESLELHDVVRDVFERATGMLRAPRALLLIREEKGDAWQELLWNRGALEEDRPAIVEREERDWAGFLSQDLSGEVLKRENGKAVRARPTPLIAALRRRHGIGSALGVRLVGTTFDGWLLFLDRSDFTVEDLTLAEVLRHVVVAQIDASFTVQRAEQIAVRSERIRLGQQLHDGLLQSMAGVVHYLEVVHRMIESDPVAARRKITEVQGLLMEDQRNLRMLLQQLAPPPFRSERDLSNQLHELAERLRRQWGLEVDLRVQSLDTLSSDLRGDVYSLANEALANVVKHADATEASLRVEADGDRVLVVVEDDGKGYPFQGRYSLEELDGMMSGPISIKRRIASRGGDLIVETGPAGTRLEMELPVLERNG